ncbi:MAG: hypothetical protein K6F66_06970, partial [Pseudobutyrivibrio sp.]|nr:hypothetical protein [Pseudobutyrivibrio sp.]
MGKNRIVNENFFDEYKFFDAILSEHFHMESGGIDKYIDEMKNANYEACERIPEWNSILARLEHLRDRYNSLNNADTSFDEFQGKDEDVVWIRIFITKLQGKADPL